jgi:hypothetical protein
VRDGRWKLLCEFDGSRPELYDLVEDRGETRNLAAEHAERVRQLTAAVLQWHHTLPPDKGPELGALPPGPSPTTKKARK